MSAAPRVVFAWRATAPSRVLAAALVVLACAWLALVRDVGPLAPVVEAELSPLPTGERSCRARGKQALAHARLLEQVAAARWERVPFALHEAPRAVAQIAEAEACFAAANDRTGRTRAAATQRSYAAELERRFVRARLLLRAALRQDEAAPRAPRALSFLRSRGEEPRASFFGSHAEEPRASFFGSHAEEPRASTRAHAEGSRGSPVREWPEPAAVVRQQLAALLALLERASPGARVYRDELEQLARHYAAESSLRSAQRAQRSLVPEPSRGRAPHQPSILKPESTP